MSSSSTAPTAPAFCPSPIPLSRLTFAHHVLPHPPLSYSSTHTRRSLPTASLSSPFPLSDPFALPSIVFIQPSVPSDFRPELVGACLWGLAFYIGFSPITRWGTIIQKAFTRILTNFLPAEPAEIVSLAFHTLPFIIAAVATDASLRYFNAGSATFAIATGLTAFLYSGVGELARLNQASTALTTRDRRIYNYFVRFAKRSLLPTGMCHLIDIRAAIRNDADARVVNTMSDSTLRTFVRNTFPNAKRSRNGFYRGLSIKQPNQTASTRAAQSSSTPH